MLSMNMLLTKRYAFKLRSTSCFNVRYMTIITKNSSKNADARHLEHLIKQDQEHVQSDTKQEKTVHRFAKELLAFRTKISDAVQKSSPNKPKRDDKQVKMAIAKQEDSKEVSTFDWKIGDRVVRASQVMFTTKEK